MLLVLKSRKFWTLVASLIILLIQITVNPHFAFNSEAGTGFLVVISTYIVSIALDPGANAGTLKGIFNSRKFWGAVVGLGVTIAASINPEATSKLPTDTIITLAVLISAYVGGTGLQDLIARVFPDINDAKAE